MLALYTGTPGSGKSLHAARLIRDRLKWARKPVIANFDVRHDVKGYDRLFHYVPNHELEPSYLKDFAVDYWHGRRIREDEIVLLVDEAQLLFNSRDWSQHDRMDWIEFLSQHRHYGYFIVFMCQVDRMLDRQIRCLAEYEYNHRKVANLGKVGVVVKKLFGGRELFVCVQTYHGMRGVKIGSEFFFGTKKLYSFYDSYSTFSRVPDAPEEGGARGGHAEGAPGERGNLVMLSPSA